MEDIKHEDMIKRVEEHFAGREDKTILMHRVLTLSQKDESVEEFTMGVMVAAHQYSLGDMKDTLTVHVVVKGLRNAKLKTELQHVASMSRWREH